jgi:hypothetical protein
LKLDGNSHHKFNFLNKPLSLRGWPTWLIMLVAVGGLIYLLNPGLGIFEMIPDNIPFIGNLDEGGAAILVWYGLVEILEKRRRNKDID